MGVVVLSMPSSVPGQATGCRAGQRSTIMRTMRQPPAICCLALDVDGVLTDGRIIIHADGSQTRAFHVQDGFALRWFQRLAGPVILISGKRTPAVDARAAELEIAHVVQGSRDKVADVRPVLAQLGCGLERLAMVGDDLPDLGLMRACGYPVAVANAAPEVKAAARWVTARAGGCGAVREAVEHLLRVQNRWTEVVRYYAEQAGPAERSP